MSPFYAALPILSCIGLGLGLVYRRLIYRIIVTLPRDLHLIYKFFLINLYLLNVRRKNLVTAEYFDTQVKKRRGKTCFHFEDEVWTFEKVQNESYKIANYFQSLGYKKGDTVALLMENRPEYICIWLGLSRIGVISSLVNFNVRLQSLEHCVSIANCRAIIFGTELTQAIQDVIDIGGFKDRSLFCVEDRNKNVKPLSVKHVNITTAVKDADPTPTVCKDKIGLNETILNIYTSGTTGLPKAVVMTHLKVFCYSVMFIPVGMTEDDILITPVPLYHVQGGVLGVTTALFQGIPQVILRKFSASRFWDECIKYNVTVSQYLGEIIRYLYNQPEKPVDKLHKVRIFFGNGVNPALWKKFVERFNNINIKEIYGSTEGNCNILNVEGHVGACGYFPIWGFPLLPMCIARVDEVTGEIIRDPKTGLVKMGKTGIPGEFLGKINWDKPMQQFHGYTDKAATEKKILRDVKTMGDAWFRTGDLLEMDEFGYVYFKDRSGDTFRWKGENVSTAEVEQIVTRASDMKGGVVYGVNIPGTEGKCGMAAIADPEGSLDLKKFAEEITRSLPSYARPLFLRVIHKEMNMTGTFKLQKVDLQKEAFDIQKIKEDSIYFYKEGYYVPLDKELYQNIINGSIRV